MAMPIEMNSIVHNTNNVSSSRYTEDEIRKLKKVCADFEAIFTYQLLKAMRKTIPETKNGLNNYGKETYTMMMDQKLAEDISAHAGGLGLQKVLFEHLTRSKAK